MADIVFCTPPFGIKSIPEIYQQMMTEMLQDIEGANVTVDDIIVWDEDIQQHDNRLRKVLQKVKEYNVKLKSEKVSVKERGFGWLVGCFGFNGPLRQYFSLYQAVSQREGDRREKG